MLNYSDDATMAQVTIPSTAPSVFHADPGPSGSPYCQV